MKRLWLKRIFYFFLILFVIGVFSSAAFFVGMASGVLVNSGSTTLAEEIVSGEEIEEKIGILRLEGIILTSAAEDIFSASGVVASSQVTKWLGQLAADNQLQSLVIQVNSPGGSPVASDEIYRAIKDFQKSGKSVVIQMEDTAASGAYFISAAGDKIYANPATLTGSIGVITEIANVEGLLDKIGVSVETYKSGQYKDLSSGFRQRTEAESAMIQEYVDTAYDLFLERVAEGRRLDPDKVRQLAQGQIYSGKKAKELGLIDELGSLEEAIAGAKNLENLTRAKIIRYRTESPWDLLFGRALASLNPYGFLFSRLSFPGFQAMYLPSL